MILYIRTRYFVGVYEYARSYKFICGKLLFNNIQLTYVTEIIIANSSDQSCNLATVLKYKKPRLLKKLKLIQIHCTTLCGAGLTVNTLGRLVI